MKNNGENGVTELVFLLDRSGSMEGLEVDTIGGFNAMIEKQRKEKGTCYVSTVLFDDKYELLHDRLTLDRIPKMTDRDYTVRGCTALIDALGTAVEHIAGIHKYARPEDVPDHTMFVITTDGMENASRRYTSEQVKAMVERQKKQHGWEFLFIGANIDAVETAAHYGIDRDRAVDYCADKDGTRVVYKAVSEVVGAMRCGVPISANWSADIDKDFQKRTKLKKRRFF